MSDYRVAYAPVSNGWMRKMSDSDIYGGGSFVTYEAVIMRGEAEFVRCGEYVEQLGAFNTHVQDDAIRKHYSWRAVVPDDAKPEAFPTPQKAAILLAALSAQATS